MADYPRIQKGLGNLNARTFNQMMAQLEDLSTSEAVKGSKFGNAIGKPFLAAIINSVALRTLDGLSSDTYGNRYLYEWREITMSWMRGNGGCTPTTRNHQIDWKTNPDGTYYRSGSIGTSYLDCTAAVNLVELQNNAEGNAGGYMGPGIYLTSEQVPEPVDHVQETQPDRGQIVMMYPLTFPKPGDCEGSDTFYVFNQDNPITCTTSTFRSSTFNFDNDLGSDWGVLRDYDVDLGAFS